MSSSANVRAIDALEDLRSALMRFKSEAHGVLDAVESEIKRTIAWLQERLQYWQKELIRRQRMLEEAQAALNSCMAKSYRDPETGRVYVPDCSREQAYVAQAKRLVQEAEQELRVVREHMKRVGEAVASYQIPSRRLAGTLNGDLLKGASLLSKSATILHSYASSASGGSGLSTGGSGIVGTSMSHVPSFISFANDDLLSYHFKRHGSEFSTSFTSEEAYRQAAVNFMSGTAPEGVLQKVRTNGDIVRYNPNTEEFGIISKNRVIRTYFIPDPAKHGFPTNLDYFTAQ